MKLDLFKKHASEYVTPKKPALITVGPTHYLSIEGRGEPGGPAFQDAIGALYNVAFTIKMTRKFAGQGDYAVSKLECISWNLRAARDQWQWRLMIRTPDSVGAKDLAAAHKKLDEKGKGPLIAKVKFFALKEGKCVQMLHVGPYEKIGESGGLMEAFALSQRKKAFSHCHHIYISDTRRVPPTKRRTILRRR